MMADDLGSEIRRLAAEAARLAAGSALEPEAEEVARRFEEPLRVAIAGRIKAGKSTLLNALVGERLAATDAGECTRVVTWYRHALGYAVSAELRAGERRELDFSRQDGTLEVDLGDTSHEVIARIEVGWPSRKLVDMTLIDTPGLGSTDEPSSARTAGALLEGGPDGPGEADAVLYLMRHMHRSDAQFLEAFTDRSVSHASPINAIVVLSRADEIGAARPDALVAARAVAARYAADGRVRELASGVVPVAGLLAETGATLRQQEFDWLRDLARLDSERLRGLLVSVDRFRDPERHPHGSEVREELLRRFGLFGLRASVELIASGQVRTAGELSETLLELSGIRDLLRLLSDRYAARAQALKARTALAGLRSIAARLARGGVAGAADLAAEIERIETASGAMAMLRLLHLVLGGHVPVSDEERQEVDRLCSAASPARRAGLPEPSTVDEIRTAALAGVERWRARGADPLSNRRTVEAADIISRAYEEVFALAR